MQERAIAKRRAEMEQMAARGLASEAHVRSLASEAQQSSEAVDALNAELAQKSERIGELEAEVARLRNALEEGAMGARRALDELRIQMSTSHDAALAAERTRADQLANACEERSASTEEWVTRMMEATSSKVERLERSLAQASLRVKTATRTQSSMSTGVAFGMPEAHRGLGGGAAHQQHAWSRGGVVLGAGGSRESPGWPQGGGGKKPSSPDRRAPSRGSTDYQRTPKPRSPPSTCTTRAGGDPYKSTDAPLPPRLATAAEPATELAAAEDRPRTIERPPALASASMPSLPTSHSRHLQQRASGEPPPVPPGTPHGEAHGEAEAPSPLALDAPDAAADIGLDIGHGGRGLPTASSSKPAARCHPRSRCEPSMEGATRAKEDDLANGGAGRSCGFAPPVGANRAPRVHAPLNNIDFPPRPTSAEAIDPSARPLTGDVRAQAPSGAPPIAPPALPPAAADEDDPRSIMRRAWLAHSQAPAADPPGVRSASCRPCTSSQTTLLSSYVVGHDLMPGSATIKGPKARAATPSPSCAVDAHEASSATPLLPVRSLGRISRLHAMPSIPSLASTGCDLSVASSPVAVQALAALHEMQMSPPLALPHAGGARKKKAADSPAITTVLATASSGQGRAALTMPSSRMPSRGRGAR